MSDDSGWAGRIDTAYFPGGVAPPAMALSATRLAPTRDSIDSRRARYVARLAIPDGVKVHEQDVEVDGRLVRCRFYDGAGGTRRPLVVYCHSGAYVLGNLDTDHHRCLQLASQVGCLVVSVAYRLAPEHPYPAGLDDSFGVLASLAGDPGPHDVDPDRIAVAGCSAGGGLAAALALRARDELPGTPLRFQLLHQPMLDSRCATASMEEFSDTPFFDAVSARYAWDVYRGGGDLGAYGSPVQTPSVAGVAPAFIGCADVDPLRDDAFGYATRLIQAGVPTEFHVYPRTSHGFEAIGPDVPQAAAVLREQAVALKAALV